MQVGDQWHLCQHLECSVRSLFVRDANSFEDTIHDVVPLSIVLETNFSLSDHSQQSLDCNLAYFQLGLVHALDGTLKNQAKLIERQWFAFHEFTEIAKRLDRSKSDQVIVGGSRSVGEDPYKVVPVAQGNLDTCNRCNAKGKILDFAFIIYVEHLLQGFLNECSGLLINLEPAAVA